MSALEVSEQIATRVTARQPVRFPGPTVRLTHAHAGLVPHSRAMSAIPDATRRRVSFPRELTRSRWRPLQAAAAAPPQKTQAHAKGAHLASRHGHCVYSPIMWTYSHSTGKLTHNGKIVASGYSGTGTGRNNPLAESQRNVRPIPRGRYVIGAPRDTASHGPRVLPWRFHPTSRSPRSVPSPRCLSLT